MIRINMDGRKTGNARGCYLMAGILLTIGVLLGVALGCSEYQHMRDASLWTVAGFALGALLLVALGRSLLARARLALLDPRRRLIRIPGRPDLPLKAVVAIAFRTEPHTYTVGFPHPVNVTEIQCTLSLLTRSVDQQIHRALDSASQLWKDRGQGPIPITAERQLRRLANALKGSPEESVIELAGSVTPGYAAVVREQLAQYLRVPCLEIPHDGGCVLLPPGA